ncbi:MAG: fibronectin type III domain-containing protein [Kofleriaceae bacterium]
MASFRLVLAGSLALSLGASTAEAGECHLVDVQFQPERRTDLRPAKSQPPQIVIWLEDAAGNYKDTLFITQQTGTYGLGNRPGRWDFNSAPQWPYGRRLGVFPVWAHRKTPRDFDEIAFQLNSSKDLEPDENNLSHPFNKSSRELHYCRPMQPEEPAYDALTCASPNVVFTDKGVRNAATRNPYPPRQDAIRAPGMDHADVDTYNDMNPFDAVSQATPLTGQLATISWPIPAGFPMGDYVVWMEVSTEFDHNDTYSTTAYPAPTGIPWSEYGEPYRGQPSLVFKVPFRFGPVADLANTATYAGYGDIDGATGTLHPPDGTITLDKIGSGLGRLALVSDPDGDYRARVKLRLEFDYVAPANPAQLEVEATSRTATVRFLAPGDDNTTGKVKGYEIRYRAGGEEITAENWGEALAYPGAPLPLDPGSLQSFDITGLLPETEYTVGIRALDDCHNQSEIRSISFITPERAIGEVDACFVATAAYGSALAADVTMLRHLRDSMLRKTVLGELAVQTYYTFSPAVAGMIGESDLLRWTAREVLVPVVRFVRELRF